MSERLPPRMSWDLNRMQNWILGKLQEGFWVLFEQEEQGSDLPTAWGRWCNVDRFGDKWSILPPRESPQTRLLRERLVSGSPRLVGNSWKRWNRSCGADQRWSVLLWVRQIRLKKKTWVFSPAKKNNCWPEEDNMEAIQKRKYSELHSELDSANWC